MRKVSATAAGFAAFTVVEYLLQELVIKGVVTTEEAREILDSAASRHDDAAYGDEEKVALNNDSAYVIRSLSKGLKPLFKAVEEADRRNRREAEPPADDGLVTRLATIRRGRDKDAG